MRILAIDTSAGTQVALVVDGVVAARAGTPEGRGHAEHTTPFVHDVLAAGGLEPRDLDLVAVGTGPAPFTGLRVGLVSAQLLGRAAGVAVAGVPSLEAWAQGWFERCADGAAGPSAAGPGEVRVATDARRREVYTARYVAGEHGPVAVDGPRVVRPADLADEVTRERAAGIAVVGPGLYPDVLGDVADVPFDVAHLAAIAWLRTQAGEPVPVEPLYLRRPDVHGVLGDALAVGAPEAAR
ncbi:tRNA (adenosine(37)-N6)-threonylcarbamoyltransferase complex dimerization subunit type 1 TsaB [Miniimonas arenae]|uniref:tRNA (Adenosine(37)-N6)-threonylcarbamoyltransferase complex dimerization subunit type 1 TsaB n=1 Tax=Miniimonas arenae TaxID=676201 RepID=A0A5C5BBG6_9MICO|nr:MULTISPECIES: tRNA (adenosine(37)-N6)-threonylcarbamoyltransferase complex dimerization subunit type 1 TsaB [Miniimonas]TNU73874.1 tRNA (adenosine(37)-N6)-threonylcarbamoyltransferase complex dimerization subunit type 1 TsaB [Miniimonas arenae]